MDWNKIFDLNTLKAIQGIKMPDFTNMLPKFPDTPKLSIPEPMPMAKIFSPKLREALNEEREQINKIVSETYYNVGQICHFRNSIKNNPEYSDLVSKSILAAIFLSIFCIAVPLLALPIDHSLTFVELLKHILLSLFSIKGLFVVIMTTFICGVFIVFISRNNKMKYSKQDFDLLDEWMDLGNYSEYLKNYAENTSANNMDNP